MISILKKKGDIYRCSGCLMRQPKPLKPNCPFCGDMFSNFESITIEEYKEHEENLRRKDYNQEGLARE